MNERKINIAKVVVGAGVNLAMFGAVLHENNKMNKFINERDSRRDRVKSSTQEGVVEVPQNRM